MNVTVTQQWNGRDVKIRGKRAVGKSAFEIGLIVESNAKMLAPVDTGRLAGSITTQSKTAGTRPEPPAYAIDQIKAPTNDNEVYVGTPVAYGPYQEFGTIRSSAQPFLRPALALAQGKSLTIVQEEGRFHFKEYLK